MFHLVRRDARATTLCLALTLLLAPAVRAQEKSINPGINAQYEKDPDPNGT